MQQHNSGQESAGDLSPAEAQTLALPKTTSLWEVVSPYLEIQGIFNQYLASGEHAWDAGVRYGIAFQFDIKIQRIDVPAWARSHVADLDGVIDFGFSLTLSEFRDYIGGKYDWIDQVHVVGRTGGWFVVVPKNTEGLQEFLYDTEFDDNVAIGDPQSHDYSLMDKIAHDLVDIDHLIRNGKQKLVELLSSARTWREYVANNNENTAPYVSPEEVVTASQTLFDATPSEETVPEERTFVNPLLDQKLRRTNPKRYDQRADWYTSNNEQGHDSPIENRYDDAPALTAGLRSSTLIHDDISATLEVLDWEIDHTIEASQLNKTVVMDNDSFLAKLVARSNLYQVFNRFSIASESPDIPYRDFPSIVKHFIEQHFATTLERHPDLLETLHGMRIVFMPRPLHPKGLPDLTLPDTIGAEYFDGDNVIRYYLEPATLQKYWRAIVHEIVHVIQSKLKGEDPDITPPPKDDDPAYYEDHDTYMKDPAEAQAYDVEDKFVEYKKDIEES
jgi:uncharacterized protein YozE (UPF0346 family)